MVCVFARVVDGGVTKDKAAFSFLRRVSLATTGTQWNEGAEVQMWDADGCGCGSLYYR